MLKLEGGVFFFFLIPGIGAHTKTQSQKTVLENSGTVDSVSRGHTDSWSRGLDTEGRKKKHRP